MELVAYFPKKFQKDPNRDLTTLRFNRSNAILDKIIDERPGIDQQIFGLEREILEMDKPNVWNVWSENNMDRMMEVDFAKFGIAVSRETKQDLENMTIFKFYTAVELLEEEKPQNKDA